MNVEASCATCRHRSCCLPGSLPDDKVRALAFARRPVKAEQKIYRIGDPFGFIYAVHSGSFKSTLRRRDGADQVSAFLSEGELFGMDGLASGQQTSNAEALEDSEVCVIPHDALASLCAGDSALQSVVNRVMSREIVREHDLVLLLGTRSAEERLTAFLLAVSRRLKARGYSGSEFQLRMSRSDIGSYLGITPETVARTLGQLQQKRLIAVNKRLVRILDMEGMQQLFEAAVA